VPDPCPDFEENILPRRRARIEARKKLLAGEISATNESAKTVNVLYVALVSREKGAFDTIEGVALANKKLADEKSPLRFRLTLVGAFSSKDEEVGLRELVRKLEFQDSIEILGFVSTARKVRAFAEADLFCFPTYYLAENQPGNLIEALAFGLPTVTTRWRSIPEMLPPDYPGLVDPKSPGQIAEALRLMVANDFSEQLRAIFLQRFTLEQHLANMAETIRSMESAP